MFHQPHFSINNNLGVILGTHQLFSYTVRLYALKTCMLQKRVNSTLQIGEHNSLKETEQTQTNYQSAYQHN